MGFCFCFEFHVRTKAHAHTPPIKRKVSIRIDRGIDIDGHAHRSCRHAAMVSSSYCIQIVDCRAVGVGVGGGWVVGGGAGGAGRWAGTVCVGGRGEG